MCIRSLLVTLLLSLGGHGLVHAQMPPDVPPNSQVLSSVCTPWEAKNIPSALKNAPAKALLLIDEGGGESGDPQHPHPQP